MPLTLPQCLIVAAVGIESVLAQTNFSGTITLGSILLGIIVLVVAALFTIRSNVASVWRQEAEGYKSKADELQKQIDRERDVRHELKNELAAARAQLVIAESRPDLSVIVEMATEHYSTAMKDVTRMFEGVTTTQAQMLEVLQRLASRIENGAKETR
jgi:hypothetical protein